MDERQRGDGRGDGRGAGRRRGDGCADQRQRRKVDHVRAAVAQGDPAGPGAFADVHLVHNCLPEVDVDRVNLSVRLCGLRLAAPVVVNAMTGGAPAVAAINRALAAAAGARGLAMAVGSQTAALHDPAVADTYTVVRAVNPDGPVLANVGAHVPVAAALQAVEMLRADALQIHLNPAQELFMAEGDRSFRGYLERIAAIVAASPVPVLVKETGCGIAAPAARALLGAGVAAIDVGGRGGTSFIAIERERQGLGPGAFADWGIPTAVSLVEVCQAVGGQVPVVATGGVRTGLDVAKALALGATAAGVAAPLLRAHAAGGEAAVGAALDALLGELRIATALTGAASMAALRQRPVVVLGQTAAWLQRRGYDVDGYARRPVPEGP